MLLQLQQTVEMGFIAHAYLFLGTKAKTRENAVEFAAAVNCLFPDRGKACGECLSCKKIQHGNHPDVFVTEPKGVSFKIDQVRELMKKVSYKHYEGKYKVFILSGGDSMTSEAANSMLKVLEEPPKNTIFILLAENGDNILPTVLSRCQVIKFGLEDKIDSAKMIEAKEIQQTMVNSLKNISSLDFDQLLRLSEAWEKDRETVKIILDSLLVWFRDIAVTKLTGDVRQVVNGDMWESLCKNSFTPEAALLAAQEVERSQKLLGSNANIRLVLDVLLLKLYRLAG